MQYYYHGLIGFVQIELNYTWKIFSVSNHKKGFSVWNSRILFISLQWVIFQMIAAYNGVLHPSIQVMTQHNFTGLNAWLQVTSINTLNGHPIKGLKVFVHFQR